VRNPFHAALSQHVRPRNLGEILPEQTFRCFPRDPEMVRRPDVALILAHRTRGIPPEGHVPIHPDIAVEVVSPTDLIL